MRPLVTRFIAVSHGQKRRYVKICGLRPDSVEVIYNGVDINRFRPGDYDRSARAEFGIPEDAYVVGILAALRPEKQHDLFLEVAKRVRETRKDAFFMIIGDGPERPAIEGRVEKLGLQDCVKLTGARADVPRMLKAVDVSVLCSASEVLPVSMLESMAMELPVVSTQVGSVDEIVVEGTTGFLAPNRDVNRLADRIIEVGRDLGAAREMGLAGRRRVEELFTKDQMMRSYEDLFLRLADRG
jgi:glycosyltransferase involved in cell wall biosynthesis